MTRGPLAVLAQIAGPSGADAPLGPAVAMLPGAGGVRDVAARAAWRAGVQVRPVAFHGEQVVSRHGDPPSARRTRLACIGSAVTTTLVRSIRSRSSANMGSRSSSPAHRLPRSSAAWTVAGSCVLVPGANLVFKCVCVQALQGPPECRLTRHHRVGTEFGQRRRVGISGPFRGGGEGAGSSQHRAHRKIQHGRKGLAHSAPLAGWAI